MLGKDSKNKIIYILVSFNLRKHYDVSLNLLKDFQEELDNFRRESLPLLMYLQIIFSSSWFLFVTVFKWVFCYGKSDWCVIFIFPWLFLPSFCRLTVLVNYMLETLQTETNLILHLTFSMLWSSLFFCYLNFHPNF